MKRIIVITTLLMTCGWLRAADGEPTPFAKGTYNFSLTGAYIQHIRFSIDELYNVNISAGYYIADNHSLNLELQGYWGDQAFDSDVIIGGIGLLGRWHFLHGDKWSLFLDGGGGVTYADQEFPQYPVDGTNFNFTGKVGLGATYEFQDHTHLIGGARYFHLSNGQIRKQDDNPTYDGIQFWGGVMWTW
ncbi:MAG: lipid 3-O-deacylase [Phycisphaerales bacterium]|nr:lipid 3-O-deacylase [Phycisphaerales bacterium]MEA2735988.1 lipid 3-O-deacylase [Humisphaera sp.]